MNFVNFSKYYSCIKINLNVRKQDGQNRFKNFKTTPGE